MNTIFKIYTTSWFLLHVWMFYLLSLLRDRAWVKKLAGWPQYASVVVVAIFMLGFFVRTARLRTMSAIDEPLDRDAFFLRPRAEFVVKPRMEGLSMVEHQYPGSAAAIRTLRDLPPGIVLEAQGNPYSYTSFVSTLAGQMSYLGWQNHVDLLIRNYDESRRRKAFTEAFYKEPDCRTRLAMIRKENITYVVSGSLEREQYPESARLDFSCFILLEQNKGYHVYSASSPESLG